MTRQPLIIAEYVHEPTWRVELGIPDPTPREKVKVRVETTRDAIPDALDALHAAFADVRAQLESLTDDPTAQDVTR